MSHLRFAILGTGFWAKYQLAAWQELDGVKCVALYNRTRSKAEALAAELGVPAVYDDADLRGEASAETTAADNIKTLELVFAAYESASSGQAIRLTNT